MSPDDIYYKEIKKNIMTRISQSLRKDINDKIVYDVYCFYICSVVDVLEDFPYMHCNSDQLLIEDSLVDYKNLVKYEAL